MMLSLRFQFLAFLQLLFLLQTFWLSTSFVTPRVASSPASVTTRYHNDDAGARVLSRLHVVSFPIEVATLVIANPTELLNSGALSTFGVGGGNGPLIAGGALVAFLGLGAAVAAVSKGSTSSKESNAKEEMEPEPEPIDVSIPYDAAVILAFQELQGGDADLNSDLYSSFRKLYMEKTVAQITAKDRARRIDQLMASSS